MRSDYRRPIYSDTVRKNRRKVLLILAGIVIAVAAVMYLFIHIHQNAGRPDKDKYPILGVSLSQTDGYQDLHVLKKHGVSFVYLKSTQGAQYFDDNFDDNYMRVQGSDLSYGVYHYYSFDSSPQNQFKNFTNNVNQRIGDLPITIQVQPYGSYEQKLPNKKKTIENVAKLQYLLENYYNRQVIIQVTPQFKYLLNNPSNKGWLVTNKEPDDQKNINFWQYTTAGKVPSLASSNKFNISVFRGSYKTWKNYIETEENY